MKPPYKILFITPYGSRSGSEMYLDYLIRNIDDKQFKPLVYSGEKPSIFQKFPARIPVFYTHLRHIRAYRLLNKLSNFFLKKSLEERLIIKVHKKYKPDIWYFNTVAMIDLIPLAIKMRVPYIVHFHELASAYDVYRGVQLKELVDNASLLIGCSQAVCDAIAVLGGTNIKKLYEAVDLSTIIVNANNKNDIRKKLGINDDAKILVMSGLTSFRKGVDIVPDIMYALKDFNVHFIWVGKIRTTGLNLYTSNKIQRYKLNNVHFVGSQSVYYFDYIDLADLFVLTAREDPFPLVMIEAAAMGKPIISFDSGGAKEFIISGMGEVVDEFHINALIRKIRGFLSNELIFDSRVSKNKAREYDMSLHIKEWKEMMQDFFLNFKDEQ